MKVTITVSMFGDKYHHNYDYPGLKRTPSIVRAIEEFRKNAPENVQVTDIRTTRI